MSQIEIPDDVLSRELDGEAVLLDLRSGKYFGLNGTGARIWACMKEGLDEGHVVQRLVSAFEVDADRARADVEAFIDSLVERGLIKVRSQTA